MLDLTGTNTTLPSRLWISAFFVVLETSKKLELGKASVDRKQELFHFSVTKMRDLFDKKNLC
jgi:hypothetical protein